MARLWAAELADLANYILDAISALDRFDRAVAAVRAAETQRTTVAMIVGPHGETQNREADDRVTAAQKRRKRAYLELADVLLHLHEAATDQPVTDRRVGPFPPYT
jgi:hypothetical protein